MRRRSSSCASIVRRTRSASAASFSSSDGRLSRARSRRRRAKRCDAEELDVAIGEVAALAHVHVERAHERARPRDQRHREQRGEFLAAQLGDVLVAGVGELVLRDDDDLPVLGDPAGDALAHAKTTRPTTSRNPSEAARSVSMLRSAFVQLQEARRPRESPAMTRSIVLASTTSRSRLDEIVSITRCRSGSRPRSPRSRRHDAESYASSVPTVIGNGWPRSC